MCYNQFIEIKQDIGICEKFDTLHDKDWCYYKIAEIKEDDFYM